MAAYGHAGPGGPMQRERDMKTSRPARAARPAPLSGTMPPRPVRDIVFGRSVSVRARRD